MLFLEEEPTSPFTINPRTFPLKEVLNFVKTNTYQHAFDKRGSLYSVLEKLISNHCPDVIQHVNNLRLLNCHDANIRVLDDITPSTLHQAIRDCLNNAEKDPSGLRAEKIYQMCISNLPTDAIVTCVCSAVLAQSQPKFLNYVNLCKDPLVIFKAPASTWKCSGVQRLVLKSLCHLMTANESMVIENSKSSRVAREFLASRDSIILRCLLFAQVNSSPVHCMLSENMIRNIISRSRGIVATLLKQGLDEFAVDYLCEFVPESFTDATTLSTVMSQKETLSAPDRLLIADASLRIAIAHCSRGEQIAKGLVSTSLSVLIEHFQFVLGPVGVPVSVLRSQVEGRDTTDICRTAMFRMLNSLLTVSPDSILKGPCISAIGRIASLCKSESASVGSGAVAARRKALLKDVWDAVGSANTALGGEIQL